MNTTENFKKVIMEHLEVVAVNDFSFAKTLKKLDKNIDECINYILNTVQKSSCNGFADEEIFEMAIEYYDKDEIETVDKIECKVVVNHSVPLHENEIQKVMQKDKVVIQQPIRNNVVKKKEASKQFTQITLFD